MHREFSTERHLIKHVDVMTNDIPSFAWICDAHMSQEDTREVAQWASHAMTSWLLGIVVCGRMERVYNEITVSMAMFTSTTVT